jgi:hypothetical protein
MLSRDACKSSLVSIYLTSVTTVVQRHLLAGQSMLVGLADQLASGTKSSSIDEVMDVGVFESQVERTIGNGTVRR